MPRWVYTRTKSLVWLKKKRIRHSVTRKRKSKCVELILFGRKGERLYKKRTFTQEEVIDDYYLSYYNSKMQEIETQIIQNPDGTFSLVVQHQWYLLSVSSDDEGTIIYTRQATMWLITEMWKHNVSMEFYEECATPEWQKKYGLYQ